MDFKGIPVLAGGPGSQPEETDGTQLAYIDMPRDMDTYTHREIPAAEHIGDLLGARDAMNWLRAALRAADGDKRSIADISAIDVDNRELVNQVLGEGEVSITSTGPLRARTQESVLAGVWRTIYTNADEQVVADLLEVAPVPHIVDEAEHGLKQIDCSAADAPDDVMNALPILTELQAAGDAWRRDGTAHSINLSLLPLSDADSEFLDQRLGRGPVDILSRSYGKCQVSSTKVANVWWVRYYNSMNTLILNTLEVTDVPSVVAAAPEDLRDSAQRLEEILAPYWAEIA